MAGDGRFVAPPPPEKAPPELPPNAPPDEKLNRVDLGHNRIGNDRDRVPSPDNPVAGLA